MRKMVFIAAVAAVFASDAARADDDFTKLTVSQFLAICQSDTKECYRDVTGADSVLMLQDMGSGDLGYCEPDNLSDEDLGKPVAAWLEQHGELASENFMTGAQAAFRALWPCSN